MISLELDIWDVYVCEIALERQYGRKVLLEERCPVEATQRLYNILPHQRGGDLVLPYGMWRHLHRALVDLERTGPEGADLSKTPPKSLMTPDNWDTHAILIGRLETHLGKVLMPEKVAP